MSSMFAVLENAVADLRGKLLCRGQRLLLWVESGNADEAAEQTDDDLDTVRAILSSYGNCRVLVCEPGEPALFNALKDNSTADISRIETGQARRYLGHESDLLLFDARMTFDADAFGVLSGTLRAGGICVLLTTHFTFASRFGSRMRRILEQHTALARVQNAQMTPPRLADAGDWQVSKDETGCLSPDQHRVVEAISRLKRRRPLIITADRGRGKSAALGIAAAQRLIENGGEILVTAPNSSAIDALFSQLSEHLPDGKREGHVFIHAKGSVRYMDPLSLASSLSSAHPPGGDGSVLFVDEAAALPTHLLAQCLENFPRIVFSTTMHGYEGSGRGFAVRFRQHLDERTPDWVELSLTTPIRWANDDPLERLTNDLLCLDAEIDESAPDTGNIRIERIDRDRLALSEGALKQLFGLLILAHYRTAPSDLVRLLDQRSITLWVALCEGRLLGVCASVDEGGYNTALAEEVACGKRRLPGELLPQSLALHEGVKEAALLKWRRVMRIAVHPQARRQGIGRKLIDAVVYDAASKGVALLGASFGATPELIGFWSEVGCLPLRVGLKPERSSGEHAVMAARALNAEGAAVVRQCRSNMLSSLAERLPLELRELDVGLVNCLLLPPAAERDDQLDVALRRLGDAHAPLAPYRLLLKQHWGTLRERIGPEAQQGMIGLLYQGRDERWLARRNDQVGSAAGESLWREWCRQMRHPIMTDKASSS